MNLDREEKLGLLGWIGVALVLASLVGVFLLVGCSKDDRRRTLYQILPVVDKPPVDCPKHLCRHGQECVPCEDDER